MELQRRRRPSIGAQRAPVDRTQAPNTSTNHQPGVRLHGHYGNQALLRMVDHGARPAVHRRCACQNRLGATKSCASCASERDVVQRRARGSTQGSTAVPSIVGRVLRSPGQPLDASVRADLEPPPDQGCRSRAVSLCAADRAAADARSGQYECASTRCSEAVHLTTFTA
jgi:hypothetical protein